MLHLYSSKTPLAGCTLYMARAPHKVRSRACSHQLNTRDRVSLLCQTGHRSTAALILPTGGPGNFTWAPLPTKDDGMASRQRACTPSDTYTDPKMPAEQASLPAVLLEWRNQDD